MHASVRNPQSREPDVATIALRHDQLTKYRRLASLGGNTAITTDAGFAKLIEVHPAQVSRVLTGKSAPGTRFIAGVLELFGAECFADLFSVEPDDNGEAA